MRYFTRLVIDKAISDGVFEKYTNIKENKTSLEDMLSYSFAHDPKNPRQKEILSKMQMHYLEYFSLSENEYVYVPYLWRISHCGNAGFGFGNTLEEARYSAILFENI